MFVCLLVCLFIFSAKYCTPAKIITIISETWKQGAWKQTQKRIRCNRKCGEACSTRKQTQTQWHKHIRTHTHGWQVHANSGILTSSLTHTYMLILRYFKYMCVYVHCLLHIYKKKIFFCIYYRQIYFIFWFYTFSRLLSGFFNSLALTPLALVCSPLCLFVCFIAFVRYCMIVYYKYCSCSTKYWI